MYRGYYLRRKFRPNGKCSPANVDIGQSRLCFHKRICHIYSLTHLYQVSFQARQFSLFYVKYWRFSQDGASPAALLGVIGGVHRLLITVNPKPPLLGLKGIYTFRHGDCFKGLSLKQNERCQVIGNIDTWEKYLL